MSRLLDRIGPPVNARGTVACIFHCGTEVGLIQSVAMLRPYAICYMLNSCRFAAYDCYGRNISLLVGVRFNSIAAGRNNSTSVPRLDPSIIFRSLSLNMQMPPARAA